MKLLIHTLSLSAMAMAASQAAFIWQAGEDATNQNNIFANRPHTPSGGGLYVEYTRENNGATALPGNPANVGGADGDANRDVDDDYYFAGNYVTTVGSAYTGVGLVTSDEAVMERAWTGNDPNLRFHFNFPAGTTVNDLMTIGFGVTGGFHNPDAGATMWDVDISLNGVSVGGETLSVATAEGDFTTAAFTAATVGGAAILANDFDNYVSLDITRTAGTGNWVSLDYVNFDVTPVPEPSTGALALLGLVGAVAMRRRRR